MIARVPDTDPAIDIRGLHKAFGPRPVLSGIDLSFERSGVTAIIGPNGAGKTTLIKCLLGLVRPDAGSIAVGGDLVSGPAATGRRRIQGDVSYRERIGYMPQQAAFPDNLTGREVVALIRSVRRPDLPTDFELMRTLQLDAEMEKPVRTLSGGTRQKLSALLAFLFRPPILVLDEPTAGLDPVASAALKDHLRAAADGGATVLLTSHVMADLEELCDRVVFLLDGRVRFDGTLEAIRESTGEERLERAIAHILTRAA